MSFIGSLTDGDPAANRPPRPVRRRRSGRRPRVPASEPVRHGADRHGPVGDRTGAWSRHSRRLVPWSALRGRVGRSGARWEPAGLPQVACSGWQRFGGCVVVPRANPRVRLYRRSVAVVDPHRATDGGTVTGSPPTASSLVGPPRTGRASPATSRRETTRTSTVRFAAVERHRNRPYQHRPDRYSRETPKPPRPSPATAGGEPWRIRPAGSSRNRPAQPTAVATDTASEWRSPLDHVRVSGSRRRGGPPHSTAGTPTGRSLVRRRPPLAPRESLLPRRNGRPTGVVPSDADGTRGSHRRGVETGSRSGTTTGVRVGRPAPPTPAEPRPDTGPSLATSGSGGSESRPTEGTR